MVRVILDTNILRSFIHSEVNLRAFQAIPGSGCIRYSLAPYFYAELVKQVALDEKLFIGWENVKNQILKLIDPFWPILPHGYSLGILAGAYKNDGTVNMAEVHRHFIEDWKTFTRASTWRELQSVLTDGVNGAQKQLEDMRSTWVDWLMETKAALISLVPDKKPSRDYLYGLIVGMTVHDEDRVNVGLFYEAYFRLLAYYAERHLYPTSANKAYNPTVGKNHGDMIDMEVLQYAPLPIIVVTNDEKFLTRVSNAGTEFSNRMIRLSDYLTLSVAELEALVEPHRHKFAQMPIDSKTALESLIGYCG